MDKLWKIVQSLLRSTKAGVRPWDKSARRGGFQTALPNHTVVVSTQPTDPNSDDLDYVIAIFNQSGDLVESASDIDLTNALQMDGRLVLNEMKSLYELARRTALGVEKALDDVLKALDEDPPF